MSALQDFRLFALKFEHIQTYYNILVPIYCTDVSGIFACYAYVMAIAVVVAMGTPVWRRIRKKFLKSLDVSDSLNRERPGHGSTDDLLAEEPNIYRSVGMSSSEHSDESASLPVGSGSRARFEMVGIRGPIPPHDSDS
jgi:hypothetical protein